MWGNVKIFSDGVSDCVEANEVSGAINQIQTQSEISTTQSEIRPTQSELSSKFSTLHHIFPQSHSKFFLLIISPTIHPFCPTFSPHPIHFHHTILPLIRPLNLAKDIDKIPAHLGRNLHFFLIKIVSKNCVKKC